MKKIKWAVVVLVCCAFSGQQPGYVVRGKHNHFSADHLGNVYLVRGEEVLKYLPGGKLAARYSNLRLGDISGIDVTNPLKILLYYRDFQQVVFLDNQLSLNSAPLSLEQLGYEQTDLACAGANNSFWIYNKQNNELVRFDELGKKAASTGNLKQTLQADLTPTAMREHNGFLFLNSPDQGIYVFDIFGAFSKVISIKHLSSFDITEDVIYYRKDSLLCSYRHKLFDEACKSLPKGLPREARYVNKRLFLDYKDSVVVVQDF